MRRRLLYYKSIIPENIYFPMDILMLNKETYKQEIYGREDYTYNDFPREKYIPIGIILTPVSDTITPANTDISGYGSIGVMGVMALTDASLSDTEGTTNPSEILCGNDNPYDLVRFGWARTSEPTLLPYIDVNGTPTNEIQGVVEYFNIPVYSSNNISLATDKSSTVASPIDAFTGYANTDGHKAISPYYVTEDYKNDVYEGRTNWDFEGYNQAAYYKYDTEYSGICSALADYDGELNSIAILTAKSWYGNNRTWIENTTNNSNTNTNDCPAIEACWKYAPEGTVQGGWYLPGLGELALMAARFNKINETLTLLNQYYGVSVSLLKDTDMPYLSSTHFLSSDLYDESIGDYVTSELVFALFPNINGDTGVNRVCTANINGATRYGGYVRPFKKISNSISSRVTPYSFTPHYELMPAHYTKTFCDGYSNRGWFGQKFIVSFRRGCMAYITNFSGGDFNNLRVYGYRVKGENDSTIIDSSRRLLANIRVDGLLRANASTWPADNEGNYEGDEKGLNITGRFTTNYKYDTDGAYDENKSAYVDMDTDDFDRDGTVEPGWYVISCIGLSAIGPGDISSKEYYITSNIYFTITKKEIDVVNGTESKEAFFDQVRTTAVNDLSDKVIGMDTPFCIGQLDRPVAIMIVRNGWSPSD